MYWAAEADALERMWPGGGTWDVYTLARMYSGKRHPAGIFDLTDHHGSPLESREGRLKEWTRVFTHRCNPHAHVDYDGTSEASEHDWNDDSRDDDATPATATAEERDRQKRVAQSQLIRGHQSLLTTASPGEARKGLKSPNLLRAGGSDRSTAELPRCPAPSWIIPLVILIWQWAVACAHVAQSWKDGTVVTLCKRLDPSGEVNYRGATLLAVVGKCLLCGFIEDRVGVRLHRGHLLSLSVLQRLLNPVGHPTQAYTGST